MIFFPTVSGGFRTTSDKTPLPCKAVRIHIIIYKEPPELTSIILIRIPPVRDGLETALWERAGSERQRKNREVSKLFR